MGNPILFQTQDMRITLIDIPASISVAQGTRQCPSTQILLSCKPLEEPYKITNEPITEEAKERVQKNTISDELDTIYRTLISEALGVVRGQWTGDWCYPRQVLNDGLPASSTSRHPLHTQVNTELALPNPSPGATGKSVEQTLKSLVESDAIAKPMFPLHLMCFSIPHKGGLGRAHAPAPSHALTLDAWEPWMCKHQNGRGIPARLSIKGFNSSAEVESDILHFKLPPRSTFVLSDCFEPSYLYDAIFEDESIPQEVAPFDFILLDPPWPNASAKRKHAYTTYSMASLKNMILGMGLNELIAPGGIVGIWITNKPALRDLLLGPGGLLAKLDLTLIEECIWVKTTVKGEPVFDLNSAWKKPYEILLICKPRTPDEQPMQIDQGIPKRFIFGVPDQHSRKPCLKTLFEPLLPPDYRALEVFARYLVAGWWSWGNEVLRFNWEDEWVNSTSRS